jgi:hypothetical protein
MQGLFQAFFSPFSGSLLLVCKLSGRVSIRPRTSQPGLPAPARSSAVRTLAVHSNPVPVFVVCHISPDRRLADREFGMFHSQARLASVRRVPLFAWGLQIELQYFKNSDGLRWPTGWCADEGHLESTSENCLALESTASLCVTPVPSIGDQVLLQVTAESRVRLHLLVDELGTVSKAVLPSRYDCQSRSKAICSAGVSWSLQYG